MECKRKKEGPLLQRSQTQPLSWPFKLQWVGLGRPGGCWKILLFVIVYSYLLGSQWWMSQFIGFILTLHWPSGILLPVAVFSFQFPTNHPLFVFIKTTETDALGDSLKSLKVEKESVLIFLVSRPCFSKHYETVTTLPTGATSLEVSSHFYLFTYLFFLPRSLSRMCCHAVWRSSPNRDPQNPIVLQLTHSCILLNFHLPSNYLRAVP